MRNALVSAWVSPELSHGIRNMKENLDSCIRKAATNVYLMF
jgi:hypothetical protein